MRLLRLEAELLTANAGFEHQSARAHGEDGDAAVVLRGLRHSVLEGNRRCARRDLVVAALEVIERCPVLEEYDLAVGLAAELQADGDLRHAGRADGGATLEDSAIATSPADADGAQIGRASGREREKTAQAVED